MNGIIPGIIPGMGIGIGFLPFLLRCCCTFCICCIICTCIFISFNISGLTPFFGNLPDNICCINNGGIMGMKGGIVGEGLLLLLLFLLFFCCAAIIEA